MFKWSERVPPPLHLQTPEFQAHFKNVIETDVAFQMSWQRKFKKRVPLWAFTRTLGGSGFLMADLLRYYFTEYLDRTMRHGPHSLPSSFNVVESFLEFDPQYCAFDLRSESEHLLAAADYFAWYSANNLPRDPSLLLDVMQQGVVYSYDMVGGATGYRITMGQSTVLIAGVSLIRHDNELSCLLIAGEFPPNPPDNVAKEMLSSTIASSYGRESISPHPSLNIASRYLPSYPEFSRVLVLTRFNLTLKKHDVRYVNVDCGSSYQVFTDDSDVFAEFPVSDQIKCKEDSLAALERYGQLFSILASLVYLPFMFVDNAQSVEELKVVTELSSRRSDHKFQEAARELGDQAPILERTIRGIPITSQPIRDAEMSVTPPDLEFESKGYWKPLAPGQIGEDNFGRTVVGRTWVERTDSWSARSPTAFLLHRRHETPDGRNPGTVYIMRSPAHELNIFKVGITARAPIQRASELNATGVPLPFGILATWEVGDCEAIEEEVHRRLTPHRVSARREFFRAPLSLITATIGEVIKKLEPASQGQ